METEINTLPSRTTGPSIVVGNAVAFTVNAGVAGWNFVESYCISSFTNDGKLLPGAIIISKATGSPTFFTNGAVPDVFGVYESVVEADALDLSS